VGIWAVNWYVLAGVGAYEVTLYISEQMYASACMHTRRSLNGRWLTSLMGGWTPLLLFVSQISHTVRAESFSNVHASHAHTEGSEAAIVASHPASLTPAASTSA